MRAAGKSTGRKALKILVGVVVVVAIVFAMTEIMLRLTLSVLPELYRPTSRSCKAPSPGRT